MVIIVCSWVLLLNLHFPAGLLCLWDLNSFLLWT